jgi:hypothetical protein
MARQRVGIALKRVYDEPDPGDGTRVLVERLWPRGLSKERAHVDVWPEEREQDRCCKHPAPLPDGTERSNG